MTGSGSAGALLLGFMPLSLSFPGSSPQSLTPSLPLAIPWMSAGGDHGGGWGAGRGGMKETDVEEKTEQPQ